MKRKLELFAFGWYDLFESCETILLILKRMVARYGTRYYNEDIQEGFLLFLVTLLCSFLIFLLVLFIRNHRSTKDSAKQIFGIDLDDYDVASVEDTLKWYSYGGALRISLSLHSDEELEQLLSDLSGLGYAFDKEDVAENGAHVETMVWIRQLWFAKYRAKCPPVRSIGIVPNEDGYSVLLRFAEGG